MKKIKRALILAGGGARGAFHTGVWKYLVEKKWKPDLICGTSIGAITAAGIASNLSVDTLIRIWTTHNRRKMYRLNLLPFTTAMLFKRPLNPIFDTAPIQEMIRSHVDFDAIRNNPVKIIITAVNVLTGKPCYFSNHDIGMKHILASGAMPVLFEKQIIDGIPYWDGGVMENIPLQPALDANAAEIIVVNLSPVGHTPQPFPQRPGQACEHVFEQFLTASYQAALGAAKLSDMPVPPPMATYNKKTPNGGGRPYAPNIVLLAPSKMQGFRSILSFSLEQAKALITEGYQTAHTHLTPFI